MPSRRSPSSACCRRFAERDLLTVDQTLPARVPPCPQKLTNGQSLPNKSNGLFQEIAVDAMVFEFMGLAMLGLCVIVLAVPSSKRQPGRRIRDT